MQRPSLIRSILILAVLGLVVLPAVAAAQSGGLRYTVTVTKFENQAGWSGHYDIGNAWGLVFSDILYQTGSFMVLGESDMRGAAMGEQDLAASGRTAQGSKTAVTGQLTPAQLLVKGAITHVQHGTAGGGGGLRVGRVGIGGKKGKSEINVTVQMVDSTTGMVMASKSVVGVAKQKGLSIGYSGNGWGTAFGGKKDDNLGLAIAEAAAEAAEWMKGQLGGVPWTGSVVMVRDGKVYVNRGTREGVTNGQVFVIGSKDIIRDPDTGEVLDVSVNELARVKATNVKEKLSICEVISGNAGSVRKGQGVGLP